MSFQAPDDNDDDNDGSNDGGAHPPVRRVENTEWCTNGLILCMD